MFLAMTRPLRLEFANALYHVTSRGDRRGKIYRDDADRLAWQEVLALACERHHFVVHSFCPRSQRRDSTLSLTQYQVRYCNRTRLWHGHIFRRPVACLISPSLSTYKAGQSIGPYLKTYSLPHTRPTKAEIVQKDRGQIRHSYTEGPGSGPPFVHDLSLGTFPACRSWRLVTGARIRAKTTAQSQCQCK